MKNRTITKSVLAISVFILILWCVFGVSTSLAWFVDTTPTSKNVFLIGDLDLSVYYKTESGEYAPVNDDTEFFDDQAIYEPGYTQVAYLKVENNGDIDFDYKLSVVVNSVQIAKNVFGEDIYLADHLKFGAIFGNSELDVTRQVAQTQATMDMSGLELNSFSQVDSIDAVDTKDNAKYVALVVYMPEEVGNEANYKDSEPPRIELSVSVFASQKGTIDKF